MRLPQRDPPQHPHQLRVQRGPNVGHSKTLLVVASQGSRVWGSEGNVNISFGTLGDSGSLVYDCTGRAIGLSFGGEHTPCNGNPSSSSMDGIHFVAPICDTVEHIKATLANLPVFAGCEVVCGGTWAGRCPWLAMMATMDNQELSTGRDLRC